MLLIKNKKAHFEYDVGKTYTAGVVLSGSEVKSLRLKHGSLQGSFIKIISNELFLLNAQINPYSFSNTKDYDPKRTRKLLVKKKEINELVGLVAQKKIALVPLSIETRGQKIKLIFGIGKGLKKFEKREKIKKRDLERESRKQVFN